jgi:hypothetical protein
VGRNIEHGRGRYVTVVDLVGTLVDVGAAGVVALIASVASAREASMVVGACGVGLHTTGTKGAAVSKCRQKHQVLLESL